MKKKMEKAKAMMDVHLENPWRSISLGEARCTYCI
jgi:hypothetical protein